MSKGETKEEEEGLGANEHTDHFGILKIFNKNTKAGSKFTRLLGSS